MLTAGTAQKGRMQYTKACIIIYILRASIVSYHTTQGTSVCVIIYTLRPKHIMRAWPLFMSNSNKLATKMQHYTWSMRDIFIQSVISWFPVAMC